MAKKVSALVGYEGNTQRIEYEVPDNQPGIWEVDRKFSVAGVKDVNRLDAFEKVTGKAKYSHDMNLPNMLHAALVTSPYAHARVNRVDTTEAKSMPGVKWIEVFEGVEGQKAAYAGWLIAAIAAETIQQARDAARKVKVDYKELPFVYDLETALDPDAPIIRSGGNATEYRSRDNGNVDQGFQEAEVIHEGNYSSQVQTHSCLETHGCAAQWNGEELTVWHSSQGVWSVSRAMAKAFEGLDENKSRCITQYMGGGFGSKFGPEMFGIMCATLAKKTGRPVKLMLDRYEDSVMAGNKPSAKMNVKIGAKKDGTLTAIYAKIQNIPGHTGGASAAQPFFDHYDCPNVKVEEQNVYINSGASRAFRAPGRPQGSFGLEMALDDLAQKLDMDPYELRAKNLSGTLYKAIPFELQLGAERFEWKAKYQKRNTKTGRIRKGVGCAVTTWGATGNPGGATVRCTIHTDGTVEIANSVQDLGTGCRTMMAITAAEELGLDVQAIKITIGDSSLGLPGPASGGSTTTPTVSPAVRSAAYQAKNKLFEKVAEKWGTSVDDIECNEGQVYSKSDTKKTMDWKKACALLRSGPIVTMGEHIEHPKIPDSGSGAYGAQFAEVEVDTETGKVRLIKILAVQDCGKVIARQQAESQITGAVIQGCTSAIFEERIMDNMTGRQINPDMENYKILNAPNMPDIVPILVDVFDPVNNTGAKGLGEPPYVPTASAIGCAVANALGIPVCDLPITPNKVLAALQTKEG